MLHNGPQDAAKQLSPGEYFFFFFFYFEFNASLAPEVKNDQLQLLILSELDLRVLHFYHKLFADGVSESQLKLAFIAVVQHSQCNRCKTIYAVFQEFVCVFEGI